MRVCTTRPSYATEDLICICVTPRDCQWNAAPQPSRGTPTDTSQLQSDPPGISRLNGSSPTESTGKIKRWTKIGNCPQSWEIWRLMKIKTMPREKKCSFLPTYLLTRFFRLQQEWEWYRQTTTSVWDNQGVLLETLTVTHLVKDLPASCDTQRTILHFPHSLFNILFNIILP